MFSNYTYVTYVIVRKYYSSSGFPKNTVLVPASLEERGDIGDIIYTVLVLKPLAPTTDLGLLGCFKICLLNRLMIIKVKVARKF